jgi:transcriptional regulator with XRE-family HTH domain
MSTATQDLLPVWTVRDRLIKAREFAGMTQADIAHAIGKGVRSIARYETSDEPPQTIVVAYAYATGVPAWWIFGDDDPAEAALDRRRRRAVTQREQASRNLEWLPLVA